MYFVQRFHYTLKFLSEYDMKYQWNMISKKKHLKLNNIKTTYNKNLIWSLKVVKLAPVALIKKANT